MNKVKFALIVFGVFVLNMLLGYSAFALVSKHKTTPKQVKITNKAKELIQEKNITILLGGDVMLGRSVNKKGLDTNDFTFPFGRISDVTNQADLFFVNLESPIIESCPLYTEGYIFCADPRMAASLVEGGVDVVNLSNNHIRNFGQKGIDDTKRILAENLISFTGLGEFVIKGFNGVSFGFLGFDYTFSDIQEVDLELIKHSEKLVDVLIVHIHWGDEYKAVHNAKQKRIANILVENGADVVVGSHPHWVQDMEVIDGVPVFYSLGNLVFDQMWSEETKKGLMVKLYFDGKKLTNYEQISVYISEIGEPEFY